MKQNLRMTNFKYQNLLHKAMESGLQLDDFEFETVDINEILDDTYLEAATSKEISVNYTDLPVDTEAIFEKASANVAKITGVHRNEKDTVIYNLKNQLM